MRIALASDEPYPVHTVIRADLEARGHEVVCLGSTASGHEEAWAKVAEAAALMVARGDCDEGVLLCWSGTGICMAANKVAGIRAALCTDAKTAEAARIWNHANVLCMSNRLLSDDMAKEILAAWFDTPTSEEGADGVHELNVIDGRYRCPDIIDR